MVEVSSEEEVPSCPWGAVPLSTEGTSLALEALALDLPIAGVICT